MGKDKTGKPQVFYTPTTVQSDILPFSNVCMTGNVGYRPTHYITAPQAEYTVRHYPLVNPPSYCRPSITPKQDPGRDRASIDTTLGPAFGVDTIII
jgi:hypothetical protein